MSKSNDEILTNKSRSQVLKNFSWWQSFQRQIVCTIQLEVSKLFVTTNFAKLKLHWPINFDNLNFSTKPNSIFTTRRQSLTRKIFEFVRRWSAVVVEKFVRKYLLRDLIFTRTKYLWQRKIEVCGWESLSELQLLSKHFVAVKIVRGWKLFNFNLCRNKKKFDENNLSEFQLSTFQILFTRPAPNWKEFINFQTIQTFTFGECGSWTNRKLKVALINLLILLNNWKFVDEWKFTNVSANYFKRPSP